MIRIAFPFIRKSVWAGGYNYLLNLFLVISLHKSKKIQPVLFYGTDVTKNELIEFKKIKIIKFVQSPLMNKSRYFFSLTKCILFGSDNKIKSLFEKYKIDVVFENAYFFGKNLDIPVIVWIPDFQHRALPHLFSWISWWKREIGFRLQFSSGRSIMISSLDAKKLYNQYYPKKSNPINLVRFAIQLKKYSSISSLKLLKKKYSLPSKFFYMPNQFWKHKNHDLVLNSLISLRKKKHKIVVVSSGSYLSKNNANYFKNFYNKLLKNKLEDMFIILGLIPYKDVLSLIIASKAVLNPSLYEGRSTTVEESLALKAPLILSDIKIHKEQAQNKAEFFNYKNSNDLANSLLSIWNKKSKKIILNKKLLNSNSTRVKIFSEDFDTAVRTTINYFNQKI